jgi:hypothetical protein
MRGMQIGSLGFLVLWASAATGQPNFDHCGALLRDGFREYTIVNQEEVMLSETFERYCESSGSSEKSELGLGAAFPLGKIPVSLTGNYSTTKEGFHNFCRNYYSKYASLRDGFLLSSRPIARAYDSFDTCVLLAASQVVIEGRIRTKDTLDIRIQPSTITNLEIQGVQASPSLTCIGAVDDKPANIDMTLIRPVSKPITFACTRKSIQVQDPIAGVEVTTYPEASVQVLNNHRNFSIVIPELTLLPQRLASTISARLDKVEQSIDRPVAHCTFPTNLDVTRPAAEEKNIFLDFAECPLDTHRAVTHSGGVWTFTAPRAGWYQIGVSLLPFRAFISLWTKVGSVNQHLANHTGGQGYAESVSGQKLVSLQQGETVSVWMNINWDANAQRRFEGKSSSNWVDIAFVSDIR